MHGVAAEKKRPVEIEVRPEPDEISGTLGWENSVL